MFFKENLSTNDIFFHYFSKTMKTLSKEQVDEKVNTILEQVKRYSNEN